MSRGQPLDLTATARVRAVLSIASEGCWSVDTQVDQIRRQAVENVEGQLTRGLQREGFARAIERGAIRLLEMEIESVTVGPRSMPLGDPRPPEPTPISDRARGLLLEFVHIWSRESPERQRASLDELFKCVEHFLRTGELLP